MFLCGATEYSRSEIFLRNYLKQNIARRQTHWRLVDWFDTAGSGQRGREVKEYCTCSPSVVWHCLFEKLL